jgi:cholesterol transport system auxiliary component
MTAHLPPWRWRALARGASAVALAFALHGCTVLPPPAPEPTLHLIDALPATSPSGERRNAVLEVAPVRAAPGFDTAAMAYVGKPHVLDHFALNRWADTPARMLTPLLVRTLERDGAFQAVVPGPSGVAADLRLDTELVRLAQDFLQKPSRVDIVLRVQVVAVRERRVLATRYVEASADAPSDDPAGGVAAANVAAARALETIAAFAREAARVPPVR